MWRKITIDKTSSFNKLLFVIPLQVGGEVVVERFLLRSK
jgi:hypothetical protein